jgi:Tfp pilus assembly protein PilV
VARRKKRSPDGGFSIIELMVACTVMLVGMTMLVKVIATSMSASSFSRHSTEAAVLAEDKMEALRTVPAGAITGGSERLHADRRIDPTGLFTRSWSAVPGAATTKVSVTVSWLEYGDDEHAVVLTVDRAP